MCIYIYTYSVYHAYINVFCDILIRSAIHCVYKYNNTFCIHAYIFANLFFGIDINESIF